LKHAARRGSNGGRPVPMSHTPVFHGSSTAGSRRFRSAGVW